MGLALQHQQMLVILEVIQFLLLLHLLVAEKVASMVILLENLVLLGAQEVAEVILKVELLHQVEQVIHHL